MEKAKFEKSVSFTQAHIFPCRYRNLKNLPHWHKDHELVYVCYGRADIMFNGDIYQLEAGNAAFIHSEGIHSISAASNGVLLVAKIDDDFLNKAIGTSHLISPLLSQDYRLDDFFTTLSKELTQADSYSGVIADSMITYLMATIFRREPTADHTPLSDESIGKYKSLLDLIAARYTDITFDDAAEYMHFSRPYFSKYFCQHIGMTFTRYLNLIKISHAVQFLSEGHMTMTEISQACGFNTIRNFNRVFKSITGYSPNSLPATEQTPFKLKENADIGFDPTLSITELLPLVE